MHVELNNAILYQHKLNCTNHKPIHFKLELPNYVRQGHHTIQLLVIQALGLVCS